ncbi:N-linked glycosylation glycosyltransferase PglG [Sulfuriferula multivorans]|uniref:N-linked glycosylation glycosyltransferase PglG n=2 Tax=Sulfuriferula multivorans TaxID=1559896 RepID=A0A401JZV4_9PROT|nr:N-linked glycosylation glycosyltransferase PglG [Sulfuriferula multivorans]
MEEEVLRDRELRSPVEARRTLTRLMVIICIAVSLETVVYLSTAGKDRIQNLIYPAILLLNAVAVRVGLSTYQKKWRH